MTVAVSPSEVNEIGANGAPFPNRDDRANFAAICWTLMGVRIVSTSSNTVRRFTEVPFRTAVTRLELLLSGCVVPRESTMKRVVSAEYHRTLPGRVRRLLTSWDS